VHVALQLDYKNAWHLPLSIASAPFIFTRAQAGKESTLPMAELTQKLLLHAARCVRHEVMMIAFIITLVMSTQNGYSLSLATFYIETESQNT